MLPCGEYMGICQLWAPVLLELVQERFVLRPQVVCSHVPREWQQAHGMPWDGMGFV